ncbi:MAG: hypothetical protein WA954_07375 [Parerythrobacter sp.]
MTYLHGKALFGGREITEQEMDDLAREQLEALRGSFTKAKGAVTDDTLSQRLAEELRLVKRMLELAEMGVQNPVAKRELQRSEDAIEDLAEVVEAEDRCDAIGNIDEDIARRMTRRALDGSGTPCDNRRPSILRKTDN